MVVTCNTHTKKNVYFVSDFRFVRSEFEDALPHERTIRDWCFRNVVLQYILYEYIWYKNA